MKANRQPTHTHRQIPAFLQGNGRGQRDRSRSNLTFRDMLGKHQNHLVRVTCDREVNVVVEKVRANEHLIGENHRERQRKVKLAVGRGNTNTLKTCFENYLRGADQQFVLTTNQHDLRPLSHNGKGISTHPRSTSQTSIKLIDKATPKPMSHNLIQDAQLQGKQLHSYLSEKQMNRMAQIAKPQLGVCPKSPEIKINLSTAPNKFFGKVTKEVLKQPNRIGNLDSGLQANKMQRLGPIQKENINCNLNADNTSFASDPRQQKPKESNDPQSKTVQNPRFSFGSLKKGMLEVQSLKLQRISFQLAGDEEIEHQKRTERDQFTANDMAEFSEFSSIISNNLKETKKDMDLDSIKNDIEKISSCLKKDKTSKQTELTIYTSKPIPAAEKMQGAINNNAEYLRYVSAKAKSGVKVSPLKFRKKEEVVQHLVNAKIVSKESNSINIP